jgi:2-polyprenyl-3-methyl-5-hydroxy-6-metoxy-1,4-benzoquinol methylase
MKRVGKDISAARRWEDVASSYAAEIDAAYHAHRLNVIRALFPPLAGKTVLDFGCGDGVLMAEALARGASSVIGLDINETMIALAQARAPAGRCHRGGVERLSEFGGADCLIAANVLAYMTDDEETRFYRAAAQVVPVGGHLVVTHSNALFDLFTLNAYTVDFFRRCFEADPTALLAHPDKPSRSSFNIRENPLSYGAKIARYGFREERQEFINYHAMPPLLSGENPDDMKRARPDTLSWPEADRWRLMFQCSMFGSRAVRRGA